MRTDNSRRWFGWGLALALTLAASLWALRSGDVDSADLLVRPPPETAVALASTSTNARSETGPKDPVATTLLPHGLPQRHALETQPGDLFEPYGKSIEPPARPPVALASVPGAAPPPPAVPAVPYAFAGRLITPQSASVLLQDGERTVVLAVGETDGEFRMERDDGTSLSFTHLPSGMALSLPVPP